MVATGEKPRHKMGGIVTLLAGVVTIVVGIVALYPLVSKNFGDQDIELVEPGGRSVPRCATIDGTGDVPEGRRLWVAVLTAEPRYYLERAAEQDIDRVNHRWSVSPVVIGAPEDVIGASFTVLALTIDQAVSDGIAGDPDFEVLPDTITEEDRMVVRRSDTGGGSCFGELPE